MQFSLATIQLIILFSTSSPSLASDYALPLHLVSHQSSFVCLPVSLLFASTFTSCGNGYIAPDCTCCNGGVIGCLTRTQTCSTNAAGGSICCDNTSPNCSPTHGGGGGCEAEGKVYCGGNGCLPGGYGCCPNELSHGGCPLGEYCCHHPDGTPSCCVMNSDISSPSNTPTTQTFTSLMTQSSDSLTSPTYEAAPNSTEPSNFGTGSSTTTSVVSTSTSSTSTSSTSTSSTSTGSTSTTISSPSSSISSSSSTRIYVVGAARGSHSFIFQLAIPFIAIYYFLLAGISA